MAAQDRLSDWAVTEEWAPPRPVAPARRRSPQSPQQRQARVAASRRMRLIRRRRLDLLQDSVLALVLAIFVLSVTAGLGVVALLAVPVALILVGSLVVERRRRRREPAG